MTEKKKKTAPKERNSTDRTDHPPGSNDLFILTRLPPSSDDSHNNSRTLTKTRSEITI
jgi:hypothetical protein